MSVLSQVPDDIVDSIDTLPVLPTAVTRLLAITQNDEVSFREITRVVESDPTLMARTLRLANSPLYSTARQIKTVQQAMVLLGTETIVNLALGVSVVSIQERLYEPLPIDAEAFGRHSVAVALATRKLARHFKLPNPSEAFVVGLLHDIGKLVLLMHFGEAYARLMVRAQQGEKALNELEQEVYDLDHALVGYALCRHWNLPCSIAEAVATHHAATLPRSLGDLVSKANDLVKTIQIGNSGNCYITAVQGQPGDLIAHGWLRELILSLPVETQYAEEALGGSAGSGKYNSKKQTCRPLVQLQIANPEAQVLLTSMLLAMGFEPTATFDFLTADGDTRPIALVTDASLSDRRREVYEQLGVVVLDYAAFRKEHGRAGGNSFDVCRLWAWLNGEN